MKTEEAIKLAGSRIALAAALNTVERTIWRWGEEVPDDRYLQLAGLVYTKRWKPVNGQQFPKE